MICFFFILCLLLASNFKIYKNGYCTAYLDKYHCNTIKGFFIGIVFLNHFTDYAKLNNYLDIPYMHFMHYINQFQVSLFLFYSGYGLMISIMKKGIPYIKKMPSHRIIRTLIHFDIAVTIYLMISIYKTGVPSFKDVVLGYIGWGGFGNSNWYIFAILILWIISFIVFYIFKTNKYVLQLSLTVLFIIVFAYLISFYKPSYWYNTLLCFPLGMYFALFKDKIEELLLKKINVWLYWCILMSLGGGTYILGKYQSNFYCYEIWVLLFTVFVVLFTMRFEFNNTILNWMGKHLFEIYILMRIPMLLLQPYFYGHNYRFLIISASITWLLVIIFTPLLKWVDAYLFQDNHNKGALHE